MIQRIDHVSLAVKDIDKAHKFFTTLFGAIPGVGAEDGNMKYSWQLYSLGDLSRIELLSPTGNGSFLDNFLSNKDGGVHHITLQVPDIRKAISVLDKNDIPYFGHHEYGDAWKELFIHPKDAFGVLIQLSEFKADDWLPKEVLMDEDKKIAISKSEKGCTIKVAHPGGGAVSVELSQSELDTFKDELLSI